jgi:antitoxin component YwqK of YwqJK toxin-antitoxin module
MFSINTNNKYRCYYESGALMREVPYKNNKPHGVEKLYHESGALAWETLYMNGRRQGRERRYNKAGSLIHENIYRYEEYLWSVASPMENFL